MHVSMMEGSGIVLSWRYLGWLIETGYREGVVTVSDGIKEGKEGEIPRIEYRIRFMDGRYNRSRIKVVMNIDRRENGEDLIRVHVPEVVNGHGPMVYSVSDVYGSVKVTGSNQSGTKHPLWDVLWRKKCSEYWKEYMEFLKVLRDVGCVGIEKWIHE